MNTKELRTDFWKKTQKNIDPIIHYDELLDTLFMYFSEHEEDRIVSHFVDEYVALLFRSSDKQIIGMRIEYFKEVFLPVTAEKKMWKLSSTGIELNGIRDIKFRVEKIEIKPTAHQITIPKLLEKNIQLEPVFA